MLSSKYQLKTLICVNFTDLYLVIVLHLSIMNFIHVLKNGPSVVSLLFGGLGTSKQ